MYSFSFLSLWDFWHKELLDFDKKPFNIHLNGHVIYFRWFLWHTTFIDLHMLTHPCTSGMKAASLCEWYFWCVLEFGLLAFYWWFLHLCAPWNNETAYKVSILLLPLVHTFTCCHVFVSSWYQEDADFVSRIWQHSIFHYFTEQFEND